MRKCAQAVIRVENYNIAITDTSHRTNAGGGSQIHESHHDNLEEEVCKGQLEGLSLLDVVGGLHSFSRAGRFPLR